MRLDPNQTVWQRLREQLAGALPYGADIDQITTAVHPYVIAERNDAERGTR